MEYIASAILLGMAVVCQWFLSWEPPQAATKTSISSREKEKGILLLFDLVFLLATLVSPMPIVLRWSLWFVCWTITTILAQIHFEMPKLAGRKICITAASAFTFIAAFHSLIRSQWMEEQSSLLEGDLIGAGGLHYPNLATPWVQIGDSKSMLIMVPQEKVQPYFKPFEDAEFFVEGGTEGPLISTTVRDRFGNLVVEIKQSHWIVHPPYSSDKNYTKYAFEVKDSSGHVLLQIRLLPHSLAIQVQGEWWNNEGKGLRILKAKDGLHGLVIPLGPQNQHNDELIQEIFKYPSKEHWGEFEN